MQKDKKIILSKILEEKKDSSKKDLFLFSDTKQTDFLEEEKHSSEGQLLVDVYEKDNEIIIKSIVAGVEPEDLDISLNNDIVTICGKRANGLNGKITEHFCEECYWGKFSRSIVLPFKVKEDKLKATLKNGILTIIIPKAKFSHGVKIKINK
ncbi:Hsp20/alpha crystallin family protein [Candidatus Falkowbacteria bacterium]|jgi:HSP20 family protein|nr:Hsp20/alpha crystallin family protein [Candidatus Falkowbacteria bacterium]MBT4433252.1 Hsp20/alpha crystallin family protein [Candidatus Falkowbacteria bacterium]